MTVKGEGENTICRWRFMRRTHPCRLHAAGRAGFGVVRRKWSVVFWRRHQQPQQPAQQKPCRHGTRRRCGWRVLPTIDPFLYSFGATVMPGRTVAEVESALWSEIERIQREPVAQSELDKAIKQTRAQVAFGTETVTNQAFWLGFSEMVADHTWFTTFLQRLAIVTPQDIQNVANAYLKSDNATTGIYFGSGTA